MDTFPTDQDTANMAGADTMGEMSCCLALHPGELGQNKHMRMASTYTWNNCKLSNFTCISSSSTTNSNRRCNIFNSSRPTRSSQVCRTCISLPPTCSHSPTYNRRPTYSHHLRCSSNTCSSNTCSSNTCSSNTCSTSSSQWHMTNNTCSICNSRPMFSHNTCNSSTCPVPRLMVNPTCSP